MYICINIYLYICICIHKYIQTNMQTCIYKVCVRCFHHRVCLSPTYMIVGLPLVQLLLSQKLIRLISPRQHAVISKERLTCDKSVAFDVQTCAVWTWPQAPWLDLAEVMALHCRGPDEGCSVSAEDYAFIQQQVRRSSRRREGGGSSLNPVMWTSIINEGYF